MTFKQYFTESKSKVRPPTEEEKINPWYAAKYAIDVAKERVPELEPLILKDINGTMEYILDVIKGRWPEAEFVIANLNDGLYALGYAKDILKDRWTNIPDIPKKLAAKAEKSILKDYEVGNYVRDVIKGRWLDAEHIILNDPEHKEDYIEALNDLNYTEDEYL